MLGQLALDPTTTQKRLGDGFYEQRLVSEQIAQLTSDIVWLVEKGVTLADCSIQSGRIYAPSH